MSTLSVNYIEYFYHVFPLHLNTFRRLFYHKLSRHNHIIQSHILYLIKHLYHIKFIKEKLDNFSYTIILLDFLNNHLNIYKKPHDNLKSIIDLFVKILISAINSDSIKINELKHCIVDVKSKLSELKQYLESIITKFSKLNPMTINANEIYYRRFFIRMYKLLRTKLDEFSEKIRPLCKTLQQTIELLSDTGTIDRDDPNSFKVRLENDQNYLDPTYKSTLENLKLVPSLEENKYIQQVKEKLQSVQSEITKLKSSVSTKKDILDNFYRYYVDEMVPTSTPDEEVKTYSSTKGQDQKIKQANEKRLSELKKECQPVLESLQEFITNYTNHIQDFDAELTKPCECISKAIQKIEGTKSHIKPKLIEYIINLIDTINFIISVEPSEIVEHLKPIHGIKQELESMINSIKTTDIQSDIRNLQNLYSNMLDINLFSTNIQKVKDHISSVECHIAGIDSISRSLKNIQILINSYPLKLIVSELGTESYIINYQSKLNEIVLLKNYMDYMNKYMEGLKVRIDVLLSSIEQLMCIVIELKKSIQFTNREIKCLKSDITELECAIEEVVRNLIRCSTKQLSTNIGVNVIDSSRHNI